VFTSLFFANVIAIISSWQLHVYRQKSYQDYIKSKELQDKLEQHTKHLEELVTERTEKLKAAERLAAIGATAGMVGHDIRNPLTSITGAVFLAKKELQKLPDGEPKEKLQKNIDLIADQTLYVNKIVADLQDYARPLHPNWEAVKLKGMVQAVVEELKISEQITVSCMIDKEAATLKTDASYLKRILTNLITNSVQAMPNGGKLTVQATAQNGKVTLTVEDTGEGIPPEIKDQLFKPLVTTKSKGQGFGLAVVKRLTEGLDGTVTFESKKAREQNS
jgi:signal transduction histidine kinase